MTMCFFVWTGYFWFFDSRVIQR